MMSTMTNITLFGCGAIGSQLALHLASEDIRFTLVDDDRIDEDNLQTSAFLIYHIGMPKTVALAGLMWHKARCEAHTPKGSGTVTDQNVLSFCRDASLVIDCFDNAEARNMTRGLAIPTLHVGVSRQGTGSITWDEHSGPFDGAPRGEDTFCTHLAGKPILRLTACVAASIVEQWLATGHKESVVVTERLAILK